MKIIFAIAFLIFTVNAYSQNLIETLITGESVTLVVTGANGTIQWQESYNGTVFADIPGATVSPYTFTPSGTPGNFKYYRAKITNSSICLDTVWYSTLITHEIVAGMNFVFAGDWFRGGRVMQIDGSGNGFVADTIDPSTVKVWGCQSAEMTGAYSTTDGIINTTYINNNCSDSPIAAKICYDLTNNGYSDWFLPAKDQLNQMYGHKSLLNITSSYLFWSSTQGSLYYYNAWGQNFGTGVQTEYTKNSNLHVRCVRPFATAGNTVSVAKVINEPVSVGIATQPAAQTICSGSSVTFQIVASGTAPFSYQWKKNGTNIPGANSSSYTKTNLTTADEGLYSCVVSNLCNSVTSNSVQLTVIKITVNAGADAYLCSQIPYQINATASTNHVAESGSLIYNWTPATGLSNIAILNPVADPGSDITYTLSVTDQLSCSTTDQISVIYSVFVSAASQPQSLYKNIGENATFTFVAAGTLPQYQWKKNGINISGATASSYTIQNLRYTDAGSYTCEASNSCSNVLSDPATLQIYSGHIETVLENDSVVLTLYGNPGNIQWQESEDSLAWTDIPGANTNTTQQKVLPTSTNKKFYRTKITNTSICENSPWYSTVIRYDIITGTTQLMEGDWYKGGIVFYTDGSGGGLIASQTDQSTGIAWGCSGNLGANSTTDGALNTTTILNACATRPIAPSLCDTLTAGNYTDWFLPAQIQLTNLCLQKTAVGRFEDLTYWSSTEWSSGNAKSSNYSTCGISNTNKSTLERVRCVRAVSSGGKVYSYANPLTTPVSVSITTQPQAQIVCLGDSLTFTVTAGGDQPYSFQWKKDGSDIAGEISSQFTIMSADLTDEGIYTCVVTNLCKSIESDPAGLKVIELTLTVNGGGEFCTNTVKQVEAIVTSNHTTESGTITYLWSAGPDGLLMQTDIYNPEIAAPIPTDFYVTVTDAMGCVDSATVNVIPVEPVQISSASFEDQLCLGETYSASATVMGSEPYTFNWMHGTDTLSSNILNNNVDSYTATNADVQMEGDYFLIATNTCDTVYSDTTVLTVVKIDLNLPVTSPICFGDTAIVIPEIVLNHPGISTSLYYQWENADLTFSSADDTLLFSPDTVMNSSFTLTVTDNNSCQVSAGINLTVSMVYQNEEICLVSVDTITWKNKIMWEKTNGVGSEYYIVFKETGTNSYTQIGNVPATQPGEFIDLFSQPEMHGDKYKISVLDTCGNESQLSYFHKTVNLTIAAFGSTMGLNWDEYVDESGDYVPFRYYIYRGPTPDNMTLLDSVSGSFFSYNDVNVFDVYYYMIGVKKPGGCNVNGTPDTMSFSNHKDNTTFVNINSLRNANGTIIIYPNPMSNFATLEIPNLNSESRIQNSEFNILDVTGKVVRSEPITLTPTRHSELDSESPHAQITIERGDLKPGIYFVELKANKTYRGKLVIE